MTEASKRTTRKTPAKAPDKDMAVKAVQAGKPILDLSLVAKPQDFADLSTEHLARMKVGRPPNATFFRVHPKYYQDLTVYVHEEGMDKVTYLILGAVYAQVCDEPAFKHKRFYLYATQAGGFGLWPVALPDETGRLDSWSESAATVVIEGQTQWVRCISNKGARAYTHTGRR